MIKRLSRKKDHDLTIVLKKIKNPQALYAKKVKIIPPKLGLKIGYDFEAGDWVSPHGGGKNTDIFFEVHYKRRSYNDYDYRLLVSFPNPRDGLQEFSKIDFSKFSSKYVAPETEYVATLELTSKGRPETGRETNINTNRNYWLRVRSKVDTKGKLISENYIKIYGDFPEIQYYFNPLANDRNLEFDTGKNLLKKLEHTEKVWNP